MPFSVRMDSGWNCTPYNLYSLCSIAIIVPSSIVRAITSISSESPSSETTSEWYLTTLRGFFNPKNILAVELTGIGDDGADGMVEIKNAGAYTLGESEDSATVYGMPKEAYERGGAVKKLPFPEIVKEILNYPNLKI